MKPLFVTGIGTEVGKTVAAAVLVEALNADYWKPVQAGDLHETDTDRVRKLVSNNTSRFHEEGYALTHPMSPHAAAERDGVRIELQHFSLPQTDNKLVIEGAGGLLVPLNDTDNIADLVPVFEANVVLVIRHYLGSINHSLLSIKYLESLQQKHGNRVAIIWNGAPNPESEAAILNRTNFPVLGRIPEFQELNAAVVEAAAQQLTLPTWI